jgi:hypothetical protein
MQRDAVAVGKGLRVPYVDLFSDVWVYEDLAQTQYTGKISKNQGKTVYGDEYPPQFYADLLKFFVPVGGLVCIYFIDTFRFYIFGPMCCIFSSNSIMLMPLSGAWNLINL